jgi:nitric-oxide synthase
VTIYDWRDDGGITDTLNNESDRPLICERGRCVGSKMNMTPMNKPLTLDKSLAQAKDFLKQYYADTTNHEKPEKNIKERQAEVLAELREKKTYNLTSDELRWGARMAWRNAPRCPARVIWKKLHVFDQRHIDNTDDMFKAIMEHLDFSNNGGNIRPAITLFRQRLPGEKDLRVWNGLITGFAAYEQEDGSIIGDPSSLGLTKFCQKLGWKGKGGMFDFLPMLLSGTDGIPHYYEIPEKYLMRVKIQHPTNTGINSMNLEWFGLPGVSSMMFESGGIQFPAAPFAGWYQGSEVASRDLLDPQRYNLLEPLGLAMGLDMSSNTTVVW